MVFFILRFDEGPPSCVRPMTSGGTYLISFGLFPIRNISPEICLNFLSILHPRTLHWSDVFLNAKTLLRVLTVSYYFVIRVSHKFDQKEKQGNRGDMRKIPVTRQFFKGSGRHGNLIEKTKNPFLDKVNGSMCAKFQVCIVFRLARRRDTNK